MKRTATLFLMASAAFFSGAGQGILAQQKARAHTDSLLRELPKAKEDTNKVKLLDLLSSDFSDIHPDEGIKYAQDGLDLSEKLGWENGKAISNNCLGFNYEAKSDYPSALGYFSRSLKIFEQLEDKVGIAKISGNIGIVYTYQGNFKKALEYDLKALDIYTELGDKDGEARNLGNIGNVYDNQSDYTKALEYDFKALAVCEELGNKSGVATNLGNIGIIYFEQHNYSKTLEYDFKALKIYQESGDKNGIGRTTGNIGNVYMEQGDYSKALDYDLAALEMASSLGNKDAIAINEENIGDIYMKKRDFYKSLEYDFKSLNLSQELGDKSMVAANLANIGECYLTIAKDTEMNTRQSLAAMSITAENGNSANLIPAGKTANLKIAITYLNKANELSKEIGYWDAVKDISKNLSEVQLLLGDYKDALESYKQFVAAKDSVFNTENNIKITNLETKRELELKDKQIEIDKLAVAKKRNERGFFIAGIAGLLVVIVIISRSNKIQKTINGLLTVEKRKVETRTEELNVTNKELSTTLENLKETQQQLIAAEKQKENEMIRNRISQDIHDDISSELTRISWLSEMAKLKAGKSGIAEVSPLLEKITASSRDTIGKLGEIIWVVNPDSDNLDNLVAYMRNYISRFFTDTAFDYKIDFPGHVIPLHINPELKRNLLLVLKESLHNAVKYSQAKCITVAFRFTGNNYRMSITDDGKGIEENIIHGGGNGLKNMRSRMNNVKGACNITSSPGKGTQIIFEGILY